MSIRNQKVSDFMSLFLASDQLSPMSDSHKLVSLQDELDEMTCLWDTHAIRLLQNDQN